MIIARYSVITRLLNKENYRSIIAYNFKKSVLILSAAIAANSLFQLLLSVQDNANDAWYTISGMKLNLSGASGFFRGRPPQTMHDCISKGIDFATNYYEGVGAVMEVAREGFQKIVKSYVYEYEDMPKKCFSKVLYQQLHDYFGSTGFSVS